MRGAGFHMETLENYKLGSMKMTHRTIFITNIEVNV